MSPAYLHARLMEACENDKIEDVEYWLDNGADVNFNITRPINALDTAIQKENHQVISVLLKRGAVVKEYVLQKAIEKDKRYLSLLIPNFVDCKDESILIGVLQGAIAIGDLELAKQAIAQGAKVESLVLYAARDINSREMLKLLIENGFNIHADNNMMLTEWMGSSAVTVWGNWKSSKDDLLDFIFEYYLDKPNSIEKFKSLRLPDKSRMFRLGLDSNNFNMMKFALLIGVNKNESLHSALYRYNNNKSENIDYRIIEYILNSDIKFDEATISNAVCFKYKDVLNALSDTEDLEYGYEMAYKYEDDFLQKYFIQKGVSNDAQSLARLKISAVKGDMKELHQAVKDGANLEKLDTEFIARVINENQVNSLKYLYDSGVFLDSSLNELLNNTMHQYKAYEAITYLVELGFDITNVKNLPIAYKKKYPIIADIWEKNFRDIFDYTIHLVKVVLPSLEGKEKEVLLGRIAELSTLPYVIKKSEEISHEH
jgi:ankyrin repeat protein